jgi:hypothetical protein
MANSRSAIVPGVVLGSIAMALEMDWGRGKDFRGVSAPRSRQGVEQPHTVNDGTNNLVNLAGLSDIRAGEASREGGQGSVAKTSDGGRPGEGSPPEGPGETAVKKNQLGGYESLMKKGNGY